MTNLTRFAALSLALIFSVPALALSADFPICDSGKRVTCVVDGDTVWFEGVKYRFEEIDTPEKGDLAECMQEGLQAVEATKRLAEILSRHEFTIERRGPIQACPGAFRDREHEPWRDAGQRGSDTAVAGAGQRIGAAG
jgi:endonuclease YncB( thermonuclease family)